MINQLNDPPASPATGDRYIVGTMPTGVWVQNPSIANYLVEWDGTAWVSLAPQIGFPVYVSDITVKAIHYWDGTEWQAIAGTPGGSNTEVQFNNAGGFGGDANFTYDSTATALQVDNLSLDGNTLSATDTDGSIVLSPNGNGAIQVDTSGNTRGKLALDLQVNRTAATEVASGDYSFVRGEECTASGDFSSASGVISDASGLYAYANGIETSAAGGWSFSSGIHTVASGFFSIASGYYSEASGSYGLAHGRNALASGVHSVAIGDTATASGEEALAIGPGATATAPNAMALGVNASAGGTNSIAFGRGAITNKSSQHAHSSALFDGISGSAQVSRLVMICLTPNATAKAMTLAATLAGTPLTIPTDTAWDVMIRIVATQQGMANIKRFDRSCIAVNDGGTINLSGVDTIGTDQTIGSPGSWSVALSADNTNNALKVEVTGAASTDIRWVASVEVVEVAFP